MFWKDEVLEKPFQVPADVLDLAFNITCRCLPIDHAYALSQALQHALPWLRQEQDAGIHVIYGAARRIQ